MCSTIISPVSRVSDFTGKLRAQKLNKAQTKRANITGVQYFCRILSFSIINRSSVKFVTSFILSSFYFFKICSSFPFCFRLLQSTMLPFSVACPFRLVEHCCHHRFRSCNQYSSFVGRSLLGYRRQSHCLGLLLPFRRGLDTIVSF